MRYKTGSGKTKHITWGKNTGFISCNTGGKKSGGNPWGKLLVCNTGKNQDREKIRKNRTCRKISIYIDMVISRASQLVDMGISMDIEKNIENLKGNRNFRQKLKGKSIFPENLKAT